MDGIEWAIASEMSDRKAYRAKCASWVMLWLDLAERARKAAMAEIRVTLSGAIDASASWSDYQGFVNLEKRALTRALEARRRMRDE